MMVLWEEKYIRWRGVGEIESISLSLSLFSLPLSLSFAALQQTGNEIKRLVATRMICFVMKLSSMVVKSRERRVCKWETVCLFPC